MPFDFTRTRGVGVTGVIVRSVQFKDTIRFISNYHLKDREYM